MNWQQRFSSITHLHLFACVNTIIYHAPDFINKKSIRLLDLGCGEGRLLKGFVQELKLKHPQIQFDFYGIDVDDAMVQKAGYFTKTISLISEADSETDWDKKLFLISSKSSWPFEDDFFDIIISNQVMEHVQNHAFVFSQIKRTMRPDGYSLHLYPLKYYLFEGHLFMPLVHKFNNYTSIYRAIRFCTRLGFGDYKKVKKKGEVKSLDEFVEKYADKMAFQVNYMYNRQLFQTIKQAELKGNFDFSFQFYKQKFRTMLGLPVRYEYRSREFYSFTNHFATLFLRYVQGITLTLRKKDANFYS